MAPLTENQARAVTAIDKSILVAAGAGSGKTSTLVNRLIHYLSETPDAKIGDILAVTFTRKAAAEMKTRLKAEINRLYQISEGEIRSRWATCLTEIDAARVGTIHSLCESILRNFSIESQIDPHFEQLDDVDKAELYAESISETLQSAILNATPEQALLVAFDLEALSRWLSSVLKSVTQFHQSAALIENLTEQSFLDHARGTLLKVQLACIRKITGDERWSQSLAALIASAGSQIGPKLEAIRLERIEAMQSVQAALSVDPEAVARGWQALTCICDALGNVGSRTDDTKFVREHLNRIRDLALLTVNKNAGAKKLPFPARIEEADSENWQHIKLLHSLARLTIAKYQSKKEQVNAVDFDDLLAQAHTALAGEGNPVREYYGSQLKQICVDEFQDTNKIQAKIVSSLVGPDSQLFLIGDDKQSIYRFQGADVATFNTWLAKFSEQNGRPREVIELTESFRSHLSIVEFFNAVFKELLSAQSSPYAAQYRPLQPRHGVRGDDRVEVVAIASEELKSKHRADREGQAVADWISEKIKVETPVRCENGTRPISYGDFAILMQTNNDSQHIEKALAIAEIPFIKLGGQGFLQRQEVFDLECLLEFLHYPGNDHALLTVLRSPILCLSDDLIHSLRQRSPETSLWRALELTINDHGYEQVRSAVFKLRRMLDDAAVQPLGELLRKIVQSTHYDLVLAKAKDGRQRARNVWKFVDLASSHEEMSCGEFAQHLKAMRNLNVVQKDAPVDGRNSVKIMTIHAAKGLEFPAVLLPRLNKNAWSSRSKLIFHPDYGMAFDHTRTNDVAAPIFYSLASWLEKDMEEAEKRRLLYVAITRAKDHLALFFDLDARAGSSFGEWLRPLVLAPALAGSTRVNGSDATFKFRFADQLMPEGLAANGSGSPVGNQLSLFQFVEAGTTKDARGRKRRHLKIVEDPQTTIDCTLIEPITNAPIDPPSNWLGSARVSPKDGKVEFEEAFIGSYFHALLENVPSKMRATDRNFLIAIALKLRQSGQVAHPAKLNALVEEGERLLAKYFQSDLCELRSNARRSFTELPYFLLSEDGGEFGIETKRPDLVLEDKDGNWLVIDYKTDDFELAEMYKQANQHRHQLESYVSVIERLSGETAQPFIYFARHSKLYPC